jgi:hypothetical protein
MPEIAVGGARREDQVVERQRRAVGEPNGAAVHVDARDFAQTDVHVRVAGQDAADGFGDVGRRKRRGRHLVEQWREQVVVAAVDDDDPRTTPAEFHRRSEAAEAAAHHDHARGRRAGHGYFLTIT